MTHVDAVMTPQDLRAALRALFKRKHLSQNRIVAQVNNAGVDLGKTTLSNILSGVTHLPRWGTVEPILTACQVTGEELVAWEHAYQRASQDGAGEPLTEQLDPIDLGVHKAITTGLLDHDATLTPYVPRPHDTALAEIVAAAEAGHSGFALLLGDSSTGKTRSLWEALAPLREHGGWRLWHPTSPDRRTALCEDLGRVRPRTVVWLNESQEYLGGDGRAGDEKAAVALRDLVRDPARGPVLILGTLWREYYTELCRPHASQVRDLLTNSATTLEVPTSFADADPSTLAAAAEIDPRFAFARKRAEHGRITQYLAGGPELLHRYEHELTAAAKALVHIAMDARRMGHRNAIPHGLLAAAAHSYLPDQWNTTAAAPDWLEKALSEAARPCKGADGPLTRIAEAPMRSRRTRSRANTVQGPSTANGPVYQLADYLDQHGRTERAQLIPPIDFWEALTGHAHSGDRTVLGRAARHRGLYRDAAQLWADATRTGDAAAGGELIKLLRTVHPNDERPTDWVIDHINPVNPEVTGLLKELRKSGRTAQAQTLAERAVPTVVPNDPTEVAELLTELREGGWTGQAQALAERAVLTVDLRSSAGSIMRLLDELWEGGWADQARILAERNVSAVSSKDRNEDAYTNMWLLRELRKGGWTELERIVAERAASMSLDYPLGTADLLRELREGGWTEQERVLAERTVSPDVLHNPYSISDLAKVLRELGWTEQARMLVECALSAVDLHGPFDPTHTACLLVELQESGRADEARTLAEETVSDIMPLDDPFGVAVLLEALRDGAWTEQAQTLAELAVPEVDVWDPLGVLYLLEELREGGWTEQAQILAGRAVAAVSITYPTEISELLEELRRSGLVDRAQELTARLPATGDFDLFLGNIANREDYWYGREPDGTGSPDWTWDDLL
ncbi:hypothetical protein [Nocardia xishanensis]|uniref:HTH cro/C1-type domain-containing protein n=1 Tax=Nocardia xishanensis TaxID=238964 RepID=A0ABW7WW74_9NOCA